MYYAFNKDTKECCFSVNAEFEGMEDYIVIESFENFNIVDIKAVKKPNKEWSIEIQAKSHEWLVNEAKNKRLRLLKTAQDNIALLKDLIEMGLDGEEETKLQKWQVYRKSVYLINPEHTDEISWPKMPAREV